MTGKVLLKPSLQSPYKIPYKNKKKRKRKQVPALK